MSTSPLNGSNDLRQYALAYKDARAKFFSLLWNRFDGSMDLRAISREGVIQQFCAIENLEGLEAFIGKYATNKNIYFGVAERLDGKSGKLENCGRLNVLYSDVDFKHVNEADARRLIDAFALPANIIMESGGGLHLYWLLNEPLNLVKQEDRVQAKWLLRKLATALKGDLSVAEPAHVLRPPGTYNLKYDPPRLVKLSVCDESQRYCIQDFEDVFAVENEAANDTESAFKHAHNNGASSNGTGSRNRPWSDPSTAEVESALASIDADDYETWLAVGMALHREFAGSDEGFQMWTAWSATSPKYDPSDQSKRWASFSIAGNGGAPITIKSLFRLARDAGWPGYQSRFSQNGASRNGKASEDAEYVHEHAAAAEATGADKSAERRPLITIAGGDLPQMANAAIKAISNPERFRVFKQADRLLEVAQLDHDQTKSEIRRPEGAVVLRTLSTTRLVDILTEAAEWQSRDAEGKLHRKNAPKGVAETVLGRHSWPSIRELLGVVEAPTIDLGSGEVLNRPGYHSESGLFLAYAGAPVIVPAHPTRDDAIKAVELLQQPFREFPFVQDTHRSAFLAALITANLRRQLSVAPAFSFDAPARAFGTGKTMLCDAIGILTTGRICSKMAVPEDDEAELRKRLFGLLLSGDAVALLDNITGIFRSAFVSMALTTPEAKERELGRSHNPVVKTNMTLLLNGNALVLAGDISTRVVPIELDANVERPAQREGFKIAKLLPYLSEHRHELIGAILTLLRAYFEAGAPTQKLPVFGRFETWTAFVRQPLVWAGARDPYEAVEDVIEADPDKTDAEAILEAWFALFGNHEMVLAELLRAIAPDADEGSSHEVAALRNAISDVVFARRGEINPRAFGQWCKKSKGVIANGKRLLSRSAGHGLMKWHVEQLSSDKEYATG